MDVLNIYIQESSADMKSSLKLTGKHISIVSNNSTTKGQLKNNVFYSLITTDLIVEDHKTCHNEVKCFRMSNLVIKSDFCLIEV